LCFLPRLDHLDSDFENEMVNRDVHRQADEFLKSLYKGAYDQEATVPTGTAILPAHSK
jgi:hypothetical protein